MPINVLSPHEHSRTFYNFMGIGRLRDGVTIQAAQAEMTAIAKQLQQQYAMTGRDLSASVVPLSEIIVGDVRPILLTLLGGAGLLLLIACVNVASLVLVRSESRRREIAVRGALGATPCAAGAPVCHRGVLACRFGERCWASIVAAGIMKLLGRLVPKDMASNMPFLEGVGLNAHTGAFAAAIALAGRAAAGRHACVAALVSEGARRIGRRETAALPAGSGAGWERTWWSWNWQLP